MLLKATHLPFVGAIWAYEQVASSRKPNSGMLSISGPETPTMSKRTFRSPQPSRQAEAGFHASAEGYARTAGRAQQASRPQTRTGPSDDPQLKSLVLKLTAQVEELTSLVSQLQEQREANVAA